MQLYVTLPMLAVLFMSLALALPAGNDAHALVEATLDRTNYRSDQNITVTFETSRDGVNIYLGHIDGLERSFVQVAEYRDIESNQEHTHTIGISHLKLWKENGEGKYFISVNDGQGHYSYFTITEAPDPTYTALYRIDSTLQSINTTLDKHFQSVWQTAYAAGLLAGSNSCQ